MERNVYIVIIQQSRPLGAGQLLDILQFTLDRPRFAHGIFNVLAGLTDFFVRLFQDRAEFVEFTFDGSQQCPYFAGPFFDSQCPESHLQ